MVYFYLFRYLHSLPKRHVSRDLFGSLFWLPIEPGSVLIHLVFHHYIVVAGNSLPRTRGVGIARRQQLFLDSFRRKIMVSLDDNRVVTFGYYFTIPCCFHRFILDCKNPGMHLYVPCLL